MKPEFTLNELKYLKVTLFAYRDIQQRIGKKQDREFARIVNKLTDEIKKREEV